MSVFCMASVSLKKGWKIEIGTFRLSSLNLYLSEGVREHFLIPKGDGNSEGMGSLVLLFNLGKSCLPQKCDNP